MSKGCDSKKNRMQVNGLVARATREFNQVAQASRILERVPLVGRFTIQRRVDVCMRTLEQAFCFGYVPGSERVVEWQDTGLVGALNLVYNPANRKSFEQLTASTLEEIYALKKDKGRVAAGETNGLAVFTKSGVISIGSDVEGVIWEPEWGTENKEYWLNWLKNDIRANYKDARTLGVFKYVLVQADAYDK